MKVARQIFEFSDTGTAGDTGPSFNGRVAQLRWNPTAGDTGADLQISMLPKTDDTGDGWLIYSKTNVLGTDFVDTNDTGLIRAHAAGDRLRVKVVNQDSVTTATTGRLYIYTEVAE